MELTIELKTPHPAQQEILTSRKRFNVLKCGRRFGKTELFQELASESIESGHTFAYFSPVYKDLHEVWGETKQVFRPIISTISETVKQITFIGGAKLDFWSMDEPDSGRGRKYHRVVVDECEKAKKFQQAWEEAIRPTLTDYKGDAYLISTPKFGATYFKSLAQTQNTHPDWKTFVYTTYDNPYIDTQEIEDARMLLPEPVFNCEYLAKDEDGRTINPVMHQFDKAVHVSSKAVFQDDKRIILSIDFNLQPFACQLSHNWEDAQGYHDHTFDEIEIQQGSIPAMADEVKLRYGDHLHKIYITGDYMGMRGDIGQRDNSSLYLQLIALLGIPKQHLKLTPNPTHENSKADCNFALWKCKVEKPKIEILFHPICKHSIYDLGHVQWDDLKNQIIKRDRNQQNQQGDFLDNFRSRVNTFIKPILKKL